MATGKQIITLRISSCLSRTICYLAVVTFEEDPEFTEKALRLIGEEEIFAIQLFLYEQPEAGDIIPGSGGCRKIRWAAKGRGNEVEPG